MQYIYAIIISLASVFYTSVASSNTDIDNIKNKKEIFDDWQILCEIDEMMNSSHCDITSKFYQKTSLISFDPSSKIKNQLTLVIPKIQAGSFLKIRIDKNDVILSENIKSSDFGLIAISPINKSLLIEEMKKGDYLFIRFNIMGSEKEVTVKIKLGGFRDSLNYYINKINQK